MRRENRLLIFTRLIILVTLSLIVILGKAAVASDAGTDDYVIGDAAMVMR
jgi:hypothetical protein